MDGLAVIDPERDLPVLKALASEQRVAMLSLLHRQGAMNVNRIAEELQLPQSSVSTNIRMLEEAGLILVESRKAKKGNQKLCRAAYEEILISFQSAAAAAEGGEAIEVSMPLGLYSSWEVSAPCGICSPDGIVGLLDVPGTFLDPGRMKAALLWFTSGYVEYQFPNNARVAQAPVTALEVSMELSSEVPGTAQDWPSDITISINGIALGVWTSPGDFGDRRGTYTPQWWKLEGSQYGMLKRWSVSAEGTFVDGVRISDVGLDSLNLDAHRSIRVRIEVRSDAKNPGGVNIFGRGFGNYDQDIVLRLRTG